MCSTVDVILTRLTMRCLHIEFKFHDENFHRYRKLHFLSSKSHGFQGDGILQCALLLHMCTCQICEDITCLTEERKKGRQKDG